MDHYGWDNKRGVLLVTALGNNTVEIVDQWKRVYTIGGLEHPQASVYLPNSDRIAVSSRSGKLRFYDAANYALVKTLDFGGDADVDNMRYDAGSQLLFAGVGEGALGELAVIDPTNMDRVYSFKLGSHPESFQLNKSGTRIYVNLPDQKALAEIDRATGAVKKWNIPGDTNSHTLVLDEDGNRLFTAALQPGRFVAIDASTGRTVAELPCVLGVDDLWFDESRQRLYATGAGAIDVFQRISGDHYANIARIAIVAGAGSTSLHVKTRTQDSLYVSWPNTLPQGGSQVLLYYVND
jgi:DNA-binding beta-propeller fold protein YncE